LAARAALDLGYELYAALPFAQAEYEKDFTGRDESHPEEAPLTAEQDLAEFRELLGHATAYIALDGAHAPEGSEGQDSLAGQAYEVVGRYVVRHSDVMIAVWDGKAANGRGGVAEIVRYAAGAEVPVWWIHATEANAAPVWLGDIQDLRDPMASGKSSEEALREYLRKLIQAPAWARPCHHDWIGRLAFLFRGSNHPPAEAYFHETKRPNRAIWRTYSNVMKWASRGHDVPQSDRKTPLNPVLRYWYDMQQPAGDRAGEYADRYRSSYVVAIVLATLALVLGGLAVGLAVSSRGHDRWASAGLAVTCLELLVLCGLLGLVAASVAREWHERSIDYRILAELYRKQQALAAVGWTLPFGSVAQLEDVEGLSWVCWLFAASQRAAPLPQGEAVSATQHEPGREEVLALISEQLGYNDLREQRSRAASAIFERIGRATFGLVLICVVVKLALERLHPNEHLVLIFGLLATVLPGVSAAFVGLRSYAEWQLLAEQSKHMTKLLEQAMERVKRLDLSRPSVSQDLGAETLAVATLMLQDLEGWGRLFRGKAMEA
jgi:hypothetical protein